MLSQTISSKKSLIWNIYKPSAVEIVICLKRSIVKEYGWEWKAKVQFLSHTLRHTILSNYGLGCATRSEVFWVKLVSCKFSLQVIVVCGGTLLLFSFWSGPKLARLLFSISYSFSFFLSFSSFPSMFFLFLSSACLSILKPHIQSLSVSGEIPDDQRKWSHFLVVPRRTLHYTHTEQMWNSQRWPLLYQHTSISVLQSLLI